MEEIIRFVSLAQTDRFTITDLCEQFGISRKTAYKHLERYATGGVKALQPRSHSAHRIPHRTPEEVEKLVLAERRRHRTWGPKKIQDILLKKHGVESPPACSTIGEILRRHGLSVRRRRRPGAYAAQRGADCADAAESRLDGRLQGLVSVGQWPAVRPIDGVRPVQSLRARGAGANEDVTSRRPVAQRNVEPCLGLEWADLMVAITLSP